jgi:hypothetical protein
MVAVPLLATLSTVFLLRKWHKQQEEELRKLQDERRRLRAEVVRSSSS